MNSNFDILIAGATFTGLGVAYAAKGNSIVVERTAQVGYEFINSYNPGSGWNETILAEQGMKLKQSMIDRNILSTDGKVRLPAVAPLLYHKIINDNIKVLLMTEFINVHKSGGGYDVDIYNASGFERIRVKKIVDTSFNCIMNTSYVISPYHKSINAILGSTEKSIDTGTINSEDVEFVEGMLPGEIILKLRISQEDDWVTARHKLHQLWKNRPEKMKNWTIAAVASCFDISVPKGPVRIETNWTYLPSSAYINPLEAFEAGYQFVDKEACQYEIIRESK